MVTVRLALSVSAKRFADFDSRPLKLWFAFVLDFIAVTVLGECVKLHA